MSIYDYCIWISGMIWGWKPAYFIYEEKTKFIAAAQKDIELKKEHIRLRKDFESIVISEYERHRELGRIPILEHEFSRSPRLINPGSDLEKNLILQQSYLHRRKIDWWGLNRLVRKERQMLVKYQSKLESWRESNQQ